MLLDHVMQIVRHGKHVAFLALEQLKLFEKGVGDISDHAAESFLAHGIKEKTPAESTRRGRRSPQTGGGTAGWCWGGLLAGCLFGGEAGKTRQLGRA